MRIANMVFNVLNGAAAAPTAPKPGVQAGDELEPPFVLVAHDCEGKWDVYARQFDTPVASFDRREPACDYASRLARLRRDCLILLRENRARGMLN